MLQNLIKSKMQAKVASKYQEFRNTEVEETVKVLQDKIVLKKKEQYKLYAERKLRELSEGIKYPFYTF
jgi:hypothetical protein